MTLRWGLASAGNISHDFTCALRSLPRGNHEIVAVTDIALSNAQKFASTHNIPTYFEGYEALAQLENVDIVHVSVINIGHYKVAKLMLEHGKHVLCEKPMTMNARCTRELLELAKNRGLFFMEGIWSRSFPIYAELRKVLEAGTIGDVTYVHAMWGSDMISVNRIRKKELGGGTILDVGGYPIQLAQLVYKGLKPEKFVACGSLKDGVDQTASGIIVYPNGKTITMSLSAIADFPNEAVIVGSKGVIRIPMFWCPTKLILPDKVIEKPLPASTEKFNYQNSAGLCYEAEECRRCILAGLQESPLMTHAESLELSVFMDEWRRQVGVVYDTD